MILEVFSKVNDSVSVIIPCHPEKRPWWKEWSGKIHTAKCPGILPWRQFRKQALEVELHGQDLHQAGQFWVWVWLAPFLCLFIF